MPPTPNPPHRDRQLALMFSSPAAGEFKTIHQHRLEMIPKKSRVFCNFSVGGMQFPHSSLISVLFLLSEKKLERPRNQPPIASSIGVCFWPTELVESFTPICKKLCHPPDTSHTAPAKTPTRLPHSIFLAILCRILNLSGGNGIFSSASALFSRVHTRAGNPQPPSTNLRSRSHSNPRVDQSFAP